MSEEKKLVLQALDQMRGDNLYRARNAFRNCTPAEMQQEYGQSGKTRAQIIADYEAYDARIDRAVAWVESKEA